MTAEVFLFCHDVLTCVRRLAPIASQARHFPPYSGKADIKEERNYSFYMSKTSKYGNSTQKFVFVPSYVFHFYRGRAIKKAPSERLFIISFIRIYISR